MRISNAVKILMLLPVLLVLSACAYGDGVVGIARVVNVFQATGEDASIWRGTAQNDARAGTRLSDRDRVITGAGSSVSLLLNTESLLTMDERSTVEVARVSAQNLSLVLVEGALAADITRQDDRLYEIRLGNIGLVVRGTSFILEHRGDMSVVVMLSGSGDIDGTPIAEGEMAHIAPADEEIHVAPLVIDDTLSPFIRNEIAVREARAQQIDGTRIVVVASGAAHNEASIVVEFDLLEFTMNNGFSDDFTWPADGSYEARLYNGTSVTQESFVRRFSFTVTDGIWRCGLPGCVEGSVYTEGRWINCACHNELLAVGW